MSAINTNIAMATINVIHHTIPHSVIIAATAIAAANASNNEAFSFVFTVIIISKVFRFTILVNTSSNLQQHGIFSQPHFRAVGQSPACRLTPQE